MTAPKGLGGWIAFPALLERGDWSAIADKAARHGIAHLYVRSGDVPKGTRRMVAFKAIRAAGLGLYTWHYGYPKNAIAELQGIRSLFDDGVDGHVLNFEEPWTRATPEAEVPWASAPGLDDDAKYYCDELARDLPNAWIAHAPMAAYEYFPHFPMGVFSQRLSATLPQWYWTELRVGRFDFLERTLAPMYERYRQRWPNAAPVLPIGCTYGNGDVLGVKRQPPGRFKAEDLDAFLDRYCPREGGSLYSLEAATPEAWEVLARRARAPEPGPLVWSDDGTLCEPVSRAKGDA